MYETFEHKADIGIRGFGDSYEKAFAECAKAMFEAMASVDKIEPKEEEKLELEAQDAEELLVIFLGHLLYLKDVKGMFYNKFNLYITNAGGKWRLKGTANGEKIDGKKHEIKGEVKAVTYHQLKAEKTDKGFVAQCVVDV